MCDVLAWCHGGCPKDRDATTQLNVLCPAFQRFFRHCRPVMARLATHWRSGKPLGEFSKRREPR
jgi:sulfatase maturation enzyme AslB (radical SAM superfamily)